MGVAQFLMKTVASSASIQKSVFQTVFSLCVGFFFSKEKLVVFVLCGFLIAGFSPLDTDVPCHVVPETSHRHGVAHKVKSDMFFFFLKKKKNHVLICKLHFFYSLFFFFLFFHVGHFSMLVLRVKFFICCRCQDCSKPARERQDVRVGQRERDERGGTSLPDSWTCERGSLYLSGELGMK